MASMKHPIALTLVLSLAACGSASGGGSSAPLPPIVVQPTYQATFVLAQSNGNPATNATLYAHMQNCSGVACKFALTTDGTGTTHLIVEENETYCFSTTGYISSSQALNPPEFVFLTPTGPLYEQLPACVKSNQSTYYFVE